MFVKLFISDQRRKTLIVETSSIPLIYFFFPLKQRKFRLNHAHWLLIGGLAVCKREKETPTTGCIITFIPHKHSNHFYKEFQVSS